MTLRIARGELPGIVAHRGASSDLAEHTLAAYELALLQGADAVECDVRLTKDHQLVCVHDRTIDRTSSGSGVVSEMSLAELSEYDFGNWHRSGKSSPILTFADLMTLILDADRPVRVFIETKHPVRCGSLVEQILLAELHRYGVATPVSADLSRAVVISFSAASVFRVRRKAPMLPTVLLGETSLLLGGGAATAVGATGIGPSIRTLREHPGLVDQAAAAGRVTYCWTVNDPDDMRLCVESGVRWVATDYPDRLRAWLDTR